MLTDNFFGRAVTRALNSSRRSDESGLALVVVLWTTLLMGFMASQVLQSGRGDVQLATNLIKSSSTSLLAEGAADVAISAIMNFVGEPAMVPDGSIYGWKVGEHSLFARITLESGRVDINNASAKLLANLVVATGNTKANPSDIAKAVLVFRGSGNARRSGQQDTAVVGSGTNPPRQKGAPFQTVDELLSVTGMSPSIYAQLRPLVTVFSGQSTPDPATALPLVRSALTGSLGNLGQRATFSGVGNLASSPRLILSGTGARSRNALIYKIEAAAMNSSGVGTGIEFIVHTGTGVLKPYRLLSRRSSDWASDLFPGRQDRHVN